MYLNSFPIAMTFIDGIFVLTNPSRGYRSGNKTWYPCCCILFCLSWLNCDVRVPLKTYFWCLYWVEEIPFDSSLLSIDNEWMLNSEFCQMHVLCLLWESCGFLHNLLLLYLLSSLPVSQENKPRVLCVWWVLLGYFRMLNQPCLPRINLTWLWCITVLMFSGFVWLIFVYLYC